MQFSLYISILSFYYNNNIPKIKSPYKKLLSFLIERFSRAKNQSKIQRYNCKNIIQSLHYSKFYKLSNLWR